MCPWSRQMLCERTEIQSGNLSKWEGGADNLSEVNLYELTNALHLDSSGSGLALDHTVVHSFVLAADLDPAGGVPDPQRKAPDGPDGMRDVLPDPAVAPRGGLDQPSLQSQVRWAEYQVEVAASGTQAIERFRAAEACGNPFVAVILIHKTDMASYGWDVVRNSWSGEKSYLRTDAIPYPGFSGGPLVDAEGRVLGLNPSGLGMGASLTIPAKLAWTIAKAIEEHGGVKRGYLGIRSQLVEISADASKSLKREQASGLLVMSVEKDSPAAAAGLIVGDIIAGFAGQPVADHDELLLQLNSGVVGKAIELEVLRGGKPQTMKVTIGEHDEAAEREMHAHRFGRRRGWRR